MKLIQNIGLAFILMIYFISSSGILVFKSNCICTGENQVSVYVAPETCETDLHHHHEHHEDGAEICTTETNCHECSSHPKECGCEQPVVSFFKLMNQLIDEEILYFNVNHVPVQFGLTNDFLVIQKQPEPLTEEKYFDDPPPVYYTSLDFLIKIHQLKIPAIA